MRTAWKLKYLLAGIVTVLALGTSSDAARSRNDVDPGKLAMSTIFSGSLHGDVRINGRDVIIPDDTLILVRDKGLATTTPRLYNNVIYVTATRLADGRYRAETIFVGPQTKRDRGKAGILPYDEVR